LNSSTTGQLLIHFNFVYKLSFLLTWKKVSNAHKTFLKNSFQSKKSLILVKVLPSGLRDPQSAGSQPQEGGITRSSFSPSKHLGGLGSVRPGIPSFFLSLSTPSNRQLISFSFSKPRSDTFLRIKRLGGAEREIWGLGNVKKENRRAGDKIHPTLQTLEPKESRGCGLIGRMDWRLLLEHTFNLRCAFAFLTQIFKGET
jgi:hypothetical protein